MENKVIIQGEVMEVAMLKETGRMLDIFGVKIRKAEDGTEVKLKSEKIQNNKTLLTATKIACRNMVKYTHTACIFQFTEQGIAMEKELLNRNLYRQIKSMDKNELSRTLNNIYEMGKEDAMKGIEAVDIDMDRLRSQIGAIKGIGETRLNLIMEIIADNLNIYKEKYGHILYTYRIITITNVLYCAFLILTILFDTDIININPL